MTDLLNKLRADFELVSKHLIESGEWSRDDAAEFGAAIKGAVDRKDDEIVILWARDMSIRANAVLYHALVIRGVEASMRARAAAEAARKAGVK